MNEEKTFEFNIPASTWIMWIVSTATAALTMIGYVYATFPTRIEHTGLEKRVETLEQTLDHKLERLENKMDQVISKQNEIHSK